MNIHVNAIADANQPLNASYEDEVTEKYTDYAVSVVKSRALPDVRDGLKPVHRRILYAMYDLGLFKNKPLRKSATVVGEVMGKYHPHGDASIYDALVRMAQDFGMLHPLIDPQGNFGSIDGDPAAAMRYTECRLQKLTEHLMTTIKKKNVIEFQDNYDGREQEPVVLPAEFPNILVNGSIGIAVGLATYMPPHNLREVCAAAKLVIQDPEVGLDRILKVMPGPDFPSGGVIKGVAGIHAYYREGRGGMSLHGRVGLEQEGRRSRVVVTEIPYGVNKAKLIEKAAHLVRTGKLVGIADIRDETSIAGGIRIVFDVKMDADPAIVMLAINRETDVNIRVNSNMVCVMPNGEPATVGVLRVLSAFAAFRRTTVRAALRADLDSARGRQDRQVGLYAATMRMDDIVRIIRTSEDVDEARVKLATLEFALDDKAFVDILRLADPDFVDTGIWKMTVSQINHILEMKLNKLTSQDQRKIAVELREIAAEIARLIDLLSDPAAIDGIILRTLDEISAKYGRDRLTTIETDEAEDIDDEDLMEDRDVVITLTAGGYVKRTDLDELRTQKRGGKGRSGIGGLEDDVVSKSFVCPVKSPLRIFTSVGKVYDLKAYKIPETKVDGKGRSIVNLIEMAEDEKVISIVPLPLDENTIETKSLVFVTEVRKGDILEGRMRRNAMSEFARVNRNGKIAMDMEDGLRLIDVIPASDDEDVVISTAKGQTIRFTVSKEVRVFKGRDSSGVRAIKLKDEDQVVSACLVPTSDVAALERMVFLKGGTLHGKRKDVVDEETGEITLPASVTMAPSEEDEDGIVLTLSAEAFVAMSGLERHILAVSSNGFGKRSSSYHYGATGRGGQGVVGAGITPRTGDLVANIVVSEDDELVLTTDDGQTIRTRVSEVGVMGRNAQGVKVFAVDDGRRIVSVARVGKVVDEDTVEVQ